MRTLLFVTALLGTLYVGYWFAAASQIEARSEAVLDNLEAQGWEVDRGSTSTTGFPLLFDTALTNLRVASPDGRIVGQTPSLQLQAQSYRPNQVSIISPELRALVQAGRALDISASDVRASATASFSSELPLDQATVESGAIVLAVEGGWGLNLERFAATADWAGQGAYDLFVEAVGLQPAMVSAKIDFLRLDAQVSLSEPLALRSPADPRFKGVAIHELRLAHGDVALTGRGELTTDAHGYLTGTVILAVENWRGLLDLLEATGLLVFDQRVFLEGALLEVSGGTDGIEVPVTFADGQIQALGVDLLPAPRVL